MSAPNLSRSHPTFFTLVGIPGMEKCHTWISIPVCMMYSAALLGNSVLLVTIVKERSLHEPMYIFLCMLAVCDLLLSTATVPKTLSILWSLSTQISFSGCLAQMFSIYFIFVAESAILLAMAFDRYIAICDPLRYTAVLTRSVVGKVGVAALIRSFCIMFPAIFLLKRLPYCGHNVMPHTYCEHIGVARLACADISVNIWYGVAAGFLSAGLDAISIAISYVLIFRCLWGLPSPRASPKALHTCGSHLCVIAMFYTPAFFSFLGHRFGQHVPRHVLIFLANLYVVVPPMLNPIIYGVRTRQIREHVAQLLRLGGLGWQGMAGQAGTGNQDGLPARGVKRSFEKREMNERQQGPGKHGPDGNVFKISVFNGHRHPTHISVAERLDRFPDVLMGNNPLGP